MSIRSIFQSIIASVAGKAVKQFVMTEVQKAVTVLKTLPIAATIAADIAALKDARLTSAEKFEHVVANTVPALIALATTKGAIGVVIADAESVARELVQSIYNDTASTKAGTFAQLILKLFGVTG